MKPIPNPDYEDAQYEIIALDNKGKRLSDMAASVMANRPRPYRFNKIAPGKIEEVPAFLPE